MLICVLRSRWWSQNCKISRRRNARRSAVVISVVAHLQLSVVQWIRRRAAAALRLGCASADGAAMAADDAAELERVLDDLKRQLPEGHALAAVIADEELDFEQVLELTLDELSQARIVLSSVVS